MKLFIMFICEYKNEEFDIFMFFLASVERIRSFDRGSIELPRTFSNTSSVSNHCMY